MALSTENAVRERYSAASQTVEPALCCPVTYAGNYLAAIPSEIIEKDYGCGDPSPFVREGDVVVDLGSGGGKLCYILAQVVGPRGQVIGVDCNPEMLALARKYQSTVAERLGYANVEFRNGLIQDLQLDLDLVSQRIANRPIKTLEDWHTSRMELEILRQEQPLIPTGSVDCVVSNCVLNLVRQQDREQLFQEIFRVLKPGGRAAISDIVADEEIPAALQSDPELWSGCLSGAYREDLFLQAFTRAGFQGVELRNWQQSPWRTVEGIEFRSVTVLAHKPLSGASLDLHQAAIYKGPFESITLENGQNFPRGIRVAVSSRTFRELAQPHYADQFILLEPREPVSLLAARPFDDNLDPNRAVPPPVTRIRSAREMKGADYSASLSGSSCCGPGKACP